MEMELEEYSTAALVAEIERRKQSKVRKHTPRTTLFSAEREGHLWKCDTCSAELDMRSSREWFIDNHWRAGVLWHKPCYRRAEQKPGETAAYHGALRSVKSGNLHLLLTRP